MEKKDNVVESGGEKESSLENPSLEVTTDESKEVSEEMVTCETCGKEYNSAEEHVCETEESEDKVDAQEESSPKVIAIGHDAVTNNKKHIEVGKDVELTEAVTETINIVPLIESVEKTGKKWKIVIVREGWSKNNRYYSREMLQKGYKIFEDSPVAIYGDIDEADVQRNFNHLASHIRASFPGGKAGANIVGWISDVSTRIIDNVLEVIGTFNCVDNKIANRMVNAYNMGKKDLLGFSIDALAKVRGSYGIAHGRKGLIVENIIHAHEVTLVDRPAAGGRVIDLVASEDEQPKTKIKMGVKMFKRLREKLSGKLENVSEATAKDLVFGAVEYLDVQVSEKVEDLIANEKYEGAAFLLEKQLEPTDNSVDLQKKLEEVLEAKIAAKQSELEESLKADREKLQKERCVAILEKKLLESGLPEKFKNIVKESFVDRVFEAEEVDSKITEVREALAEVTPEEKGPAQRGRFGGGIDQVRKQELALLKVFNYDFDKDESVTESEKQFVNSIRRPSLAEVYKVWHDDEQLDFVGVGQYALQESTSADFTYSMANTLGRATIQQYNFIDDFWREIVSINPGVSDFRLQTRVKDFGLNAVYSVGESDSADTYTETGTPPDDEAESYTIDTYGSMTTFTRKTIINDDMGVIGRIPGKLARAYKNFLHEKVFAILIGNKDGGGVNSDTMGCDGVAIYHDNHGNKGSSAFNHTSLDAALEAFSHQREYARKFTVSDNPLTSGATTVNLNTTVGLRAGNIIKIEAEWIKVGTVPSGTQLTGCTRGYLGTTAAQHAQNSVAYQLGSPIAMRKWRLVCPYEMHDEVYRVFGTPEVTGGGLNDRSRFFGMASSGVITPHFVPRDYLGDTNNWYLVADPMDAPGIEFAFLNNQQTPQFWTQNQPTVGNVFTRDNIRIKGRHEYDGVMLDFRGAYGAIVA